MSAPSIISTWIRWSNIRIAEELLFDTIHKEAHPTPFGDLYTATLLIDTTHKKALTMAETVINAAEGNRERRKIFR